MTTANEVSIAIDRILKMSNWEIAQELGDVLADMLSFGYTLEGDFLEIDPDSIDAEHEESEFCFDLILEIVPRLTQERGWIWDDGYIFPSNEFGTRVYVGGVL